MKPRATIAILCHLWQKVGRTVSNAVGLLRNRTILALSLLFGIASAGLVWHQSRQNSQLVESTALQSAARYSRAVGEFRTLYTSEVVKTAKDHGLEVTHDYKDKIGAIPLPATLSMLLGNRLAEQMDGGQTRLYSPFPFPWRKNSGGLRDEFSRNAWEAFKKRPDEPFYHFEDIDGNPSLRYATADLMRSSCVHCHNSHPDSPKHDWKEGDVRGVLEIVLPLETAVVQADSNLKESLLLTCGLLVLGLTSIGIVVVRFRRTSVELENRVAERTTELNQTNQQLHENQEYVKNIIGSMIDMLIVISLDGTIVTVNKATCSLLGYREEELVGQPASSLFKEEESTAEMITSPNAVSLKGTMFHALTRVGHISDVEGCCFMKDGIRIPVTISGSVMRDREGEIQGIVCVAQNTSQQKQLQLELAQAQKLDSVGQLAAGIAHEINTPTQYLSDNTRFLKEAFGDIGVVLDRFEKLLQAAKDDSVDEQLVAEVEATLKQVDLVYLTEEIPQAIGQSLNGVEQVSKIVRAMKEFSHPGGEEKSLVNLTAAIETTITVSRNEWKYIAEMVKELDPELPDVSCLPGELNQVFLNLIVNAAHAIAEKSGDDATEKGTITVGTRHDGECVEIFVRDTGTGIPEEVRVRIFDPFFTTKEVGKGTGQGLAIARSIVVDKHGGTIDCQTEPGKGTTFIVRLPIDGNRKLEG